MHDTKTKTSLPFLGVDLNETLDVDAILKKFHLAWIFLRMIFRYIIQAVLLVFLKRIYSLYFRLVTSIIIHHHRSVLLFLLCSQKCNHYYHYLLNSEVVIISNHKKFAKVFVISMYYCVYRVTAIELDTILHVDRVIHSAGFLRTLWKEMTWHDKF